MIDLFLIALLNMHSSNQLVYKRQQVPELLFVFIVSSCEILAQASASAVQLVQVISGPAMGSLGWAQCAWCWTWEYNMYILDGIMAPLCGDCLDRFCEGQRPPWQPDGVARQAALLRMTFRPAPTQVPDEAVQIIAEFLVPWFEP